MKNFKETLNGWRMEALVIGEGVSEGKDVFGTNTLIKEPVVKVLVIITSPDNKIFSEEFKLFKLCHGGIDDLNIGLSPIRENGWGSNLPNWREGITVCFPDAEFHIAPQGGVFKTVWED